MSAADADGRLAAAVADLRRTVRGAVYLFCLGFALVALFLAYLAFEVGRIAGRVERLGALADRAEKWADQQPAAPGAP